MRLLLVPLAIACGCASVSATPPARLCNVSEPSRHRSVAVDPGQMACLSVRARRDFLELSLVDDLATASIVVRMWRESVKPYTHFSVENRLQTSLAFSALVSLPRERHPHYVECTVTGASTLTETWPRAASEVVFVDFTPVPDTEPSGCAIPAAQQGAAAGEPQRVPIDLW